MTITSASERTQWYQGRRVVEESIEGENNESTGDLVERETK